MEKKLPKVFANKIDKNLANNEKIYYEKEEPIKEIKEKKENLNINQKINKIFGSSRYVYKADVDITTKTDKFTKRIIGRNRNELITMDNELINIKDIIDIEFTQKSSNKA